VPEHGHKETVVTCDICSKLASSHYMQEMRSKICSLGSFSECISVNDIIYNLRQTISLVCETLRLEVIAKLHFHARRLFRDIAWIVIHS